MILRRVPTGRGRHSTFIMENGEVFEVLNVPDKVQLSKDITSKDAEATYKVKKSGTLAKEKLIEQLLIERGVSIFDLVYALWTKDKVLSDKINSIMEEINAADK